MIKVSLFYSNEAGKTFDMDYYFNKHVPMVRKRLGNACKCVDAEQGQSGILPGTPAAYTAMANYTNIQPMIQISEVKI